MQYPLLPFGLALTVIAVLLYVAVSTVVMSTATVLMLALFFAAAIGGLFVLALYKLFA